MVWHDIIVSQQATSMELKANEDKDDMEITSEVKIRLPRKYNTTVSINHRSINMKGGDDKSPLFADYKDHEKRKPNHARKISQKGTSRETYYAQNSSHGWGHWVTPFVTVVLNVVGHNQVRIVGLTKSHEIVECRPHLKLYEGALVIASEQHNDDNSYCTNVNSSCTVVEGVVDGYSYYCCHFIFQQPQLGLDHAVRVYLKELQLNLSKTYDFSCLARGKIKEKAQYGINKQQTRQEQFQIEMSRETSFVCPDNIDTYCSKSHSRRLEQGLTIILHSLQMNNFLSKNFFALNLFNVDDISLVDMQKRYLSPDFLSFISSGLSVAVTRDFLCGLSRDPACACPLPFELMDLVASFAATGAAASCVNDQALLSYLFLNRSSRRGFLEEETRGKPQGPAVAVSSLALGCHDVG